MNIPTALFLGIVIGLIGGFFIWRNNRGKVEQASDTIDQVGKDLKGK